MKAILSSVLFAAMVVGLQGEIRTEAIEYKEGETVLEGLLVYDSANTGKRPAVLIGHQWKGVGPYEKKRAEMLAKLGYVAFALDIYGKGVRTTDPAEAAKLAGKYKGDRALLRRRAKAGFETLLKHKLTDPDRIAAIGYCFGGTTVLELARAGADLDGVISFHGGLSTPKPEDAKKIQAKVLALHGADDPFVPATEVAAFENEMRDAKVDWQLVAYGNTVHSFTDSGAGSDNSKGSAYNEKSDQRSWRAMVGFFEEIWP